MDDQKEARLAERWMDALGITGEYTGPETYCRALRVDTSALEPQALSRENVQRILDDTAELLAEKHQDVKAERDVVDALIPRVSGFDEVDRDVWLALSKAEKRLCARMNGQDLGIGALRPLDSFGNLLGGPDEEGA